MFYAYGPNIMIYLKLWIYDFFHTCLLKLSQKVLLALHIALSLLTNVILQRQRNPSMSNISFLVLQTLKSDSSLKTKNSSNT